MCVISISTFLWARDLWRSALFRSSFSLSPELRLTFSWLSPDFLLNFSWLSPDYRLRRTRTKYSEIWYGLFFQVNFNRQIQDKLTNMFHVWQNSNIPVMLMQVIVREMTSHEESMGNKTSILGQSWLIQKPNKTNFKHRQIWDVNKPMIDKLTMYKDSKCYQLIM